MTIKQSTAVRNAKNDAVETAIGAAPVLKLWSGAPPANCAAADSGTLCATGTLPSDWAAASSGGVKSKSGTWTLTGHANAGTGTNVGHFRLYASDGVTCHEQGTVTATGDGGDMLMDNINVAQNQVVTVSAYDRTASNA